MFQKLSKPWQDVVKLMWQAHKEESIPIGSVITDENNQVLASGRNQIFKRDERYPLSGTSLAHAEMNALMHLRRDGHPNIKQYTLYTSMEPCPMCIGASVISKIRNIHFGARDFYGGASALVELHHYLKSKDVKIHYEAGNIEVFQLVLQTNFEMQRQYQRYEALLASIARANPDAIQIGKALAQEKFFDKAQAKKMPIEDLYNHVIEYYEQFK